MNINRSNYEAYLLDWMEGNLTVELQQELKAFLAANPDLQVDLELDEWIKLAEPEQIFELKDRLKRGVINQENIEWYLTVRTEGDTSEVEDRMIENFLELHPKWRRDQQLFLMAKVPVDKEIVFENKAGLYRNRIIPLYRRKALYYTVAAAVVVLLIGVFQLRQSEKKTGYVDSFRNHEIQLQPDLNEVKPDDAENKPSQSEEFVKKEIHEPAPQVKQLQIKKVTEENELLGSNQNTEVKVQSELSQQEDPVILPAEDFFANSKKANEVRNQQVDNVRQWLTNMIVKNPTAFKPGSIDMLIDKLDNGDEISQEDLLSCFKEPSPGQISTDIKEAKTPVLDAFAWGLNKVTGKDVTLEKKFNETGELTAYSLDAGIIRFGKSE